MRRTITLISFGLIAGCAEEPVPPGPIEQTTWYRDVAPIVAEHCMGCHSDGGIAPFSLESYDVAEALAPELLAAVESGLMPPWDAVDAADCTPRHGWKNDLRLDATEIDVLRAWIADGRPAGDEAAIPPPPVDSLAGVTHTLTPTVPFTTTGDTDEFVCFVLDPATTGDRWLTGMEVLPGNPKVVHHVVVFGVVPSLAEQARNAGIVGKPYENCTGVVNDPQTGAPLTYVIGAWTPGSGPLDTGDLGLPVPAGGAFLLQMHYHPGGAPSNEPDATTLNVRLADTAPPHPYALGGFGNAATAPVLLPGPDDSGGVPEFRIPAGAAAHSETMRFTMPGTPGSGARSRLLFAYPHMHYIGVGLQVRVERAAPLPGEPAEECLVNVPRWDFDWQRHYQYDAPIEELPAIAAGDTVEIRCTYDNSLANPFVRRMLDEMGLQEPVEVTLGEQSHDEMCLGVFGVVPQDP